MPRRLSTARRASTALRWPLGVALTSWRYLWRTTPLHRHEGPGELPRDAPPPLPAGVERDELQQAEDGVGPLFHRRYRVRIRASPLTPEQLMARMATDLNGVAPSELARFHRLRGETGPPRPGEEYLVRMPGPWDGPVRVLAASPTSFRLATLAGHLEAGQIEFRAEHDGLLTFTIESWARSADRLADALYHRLRMSKEVQLHMWTSVLGGVVALSGGRRHGPLEIDTRVVEGDGAPLLRDRRARRALDALHDAPLNYDLAHVRERRGGWNVDDYRQPLAHERPGPPEPDGVWAIARRLTAAYEFADPAIVQAVFHPDDPLEQRAMLLEIRFLGLRFHVGVRVGGVVDETRIVDGAAVRVWGWSYRTLKGHFEMGQMDYEVWKQLETGAVEFRIHVASRAAPVRNPFVRFGFRLVGRSQQRRFARRACERMARLTAAEIAPGSGGPPVARAADEVGVRPASARDA